MTAECVFLLLYSYTLRTLHGVLRFPYPETDLAKKREGKKKKKAPCMVLTRSVLLCISASLTSIKPRCSDAASDCPAERPDARLLPIGLVECLATALRLLFSHCRILPNTTFWLVCMMWAVVPSPTESGGIESSTNVRVHGSWSCGWSMGSYRYTYVSVYMCTCQIQIHTRHTVRCMHLHRTCSCPPTRLAISRRGTPTLQVR